MNPRHSPGRTPPHRRQTATPFLRRPCEQCDTRAPAAAAVRATRLAHVSRMQPDLGLLAARRLAQYGRHFASLLVPVCASCDAQNRAISAPVTRRHRDPARIQFETSAGRILLQTTASRLKSLWLKALSVVAWSSLYCSGQRGRLRRRRNSRADSRHSALSAALRGKFRTKAVHGLHKMAKHPSTCLMQPSISATGNAWEIRTHEVKVEA